MMKIFLVTRNDEFDCDQHDAAVVAAESPVDAINLIKETYSRGDWQYWNVWGDFDLSAKEITLNEREIILER
jgi:hypothetical protein